MSQDNTVITSRAAIGQNTSLLCLSVAVEVGAGKRRTLARATSTRGPGNTFPRQREDRKGAFVALGEVSLTEQPVAVRPIFAIGVLRAAPHLASGALVAAVGLRSLLHISGAGRRSALERRAAFAKQIWVAARAQRAAVLSMRGHALHHGAWRDGAFGLDTCMAASASGAPVHTSRRSVEREASSTFWGNTGRADLTRVVSSVRR